MGSITQSEYTRRLPDFDELLQDVDSFLKASAAITAEDDLPTLLDVAVPALSRRLCEMGTQVGPTPGNTTADLLVCHHNDVEKGVLTLRVYESFPSYGLDRAVNVRGEYWGVHKRKVHYLGADANDPNNNRDVVAEALLQGQDRWRKVADKDAPPSERDVMAVCSFIPGELRGANTTEKLKSIRPGHIVSMSIVFYHEEPTGYNWALEFARRRIEIVRILDALHAMSIPRGHAPDEIRSAWSIAAGMLAQRSKAIVKLTMAQMLTHLLGQLPALPGD